MFGSNRSLLNLWLLAGAFPFYGFAQTVESAATTNTPRTDLRVLESLEYDLGNRSVIFNRVQLPPARPAPVSTAPVAAPVSPEIEEINRRRANKKSEMLFLSATVYDRRVTEVRWSSQGRDYRAFSNIDFHYLAGAGEIETADTVYMLVMGLGDGTSEEVAAFNQNAAARGWPLKTLPAPESFSQTRSEYRLIGETISTAAPEALAAMDALHAFFDTNRATLLANYAKREADRIAREQWLKDHPPVPKDTVINFWPKKSTIYPAK
jgi:hypothetical protein